MRFCIDLIISEFVQGKSLSSLFTCDACTDNMIISIYFTHNINNTGRARLIRSSTLFEVSVKCFPIILYLQECVPVGWVLPAAEAIGRSPPGTPPPE